MLVIKKYLVCNIMTLISDIPILKLAYEAEQKHGEDTHMVIEVVLKNDIPEDKLKTNEVTTDDVLWWVEFEDNQMVFDDFAAVEDYLLNQVKKNESK